MQNNSFNQIFSTTFVATISFMLLPSVTLALSPGDKINERAITPMGKVDPNVRILPGDAQRTGINSDAKPYLQTRSLKPPSHVKGLNNDFANRLAKFFKAGESAGKSMKIYSGYRSPEHQARLFEAAKKKHGANARKWVAPPGGSNHNRGIAADLKFGPGARAWAHANAGAFGLKFRMAHEPWHIEPSGGVSPGGEGATGNNEGNFAQGVGDGMGSNPELPEMPQGGGSGGGSSSGGNFGPGDYIWDDEELPEDGDLNDEFGSADYFGLDTEDEDFDEPYEDSTDTEYANGADTDFTKITPTTTAALIKENIYSNTFRELTDPHLRSIYQFLTARLGKKASTSDIQGLNPHFAQCLVAIIRATEADGFAVSIESGYRTEEQQRKLRFKAEAEYSRESVDQWVDQPKNSFHVKGIAVDFSFSSIKARDWFYRNSKVFGLHFPNERKPYHMQAFTSLCASLKESAYGPAIDSQYKPNNFRLPAIEDINISTIKQIRPELLPENKEIEDVPIQKIIYQKTQRFFQDVRYNYELSDGVEDTHMVLNGLIDKDLTGIGLRTTWFQILLRMIGLGQ